MRAVLSRNYFYAAAQCKEVLQRSMYLESFNWCLEYRTKKDSKKTACLSFFKSHVSSVQKLTPESFDKTFKSAVPSRDYFLSHIEESTGEQVLRSAKVVFSAYLQ